MVSGCIPWGRSRLLSSSGIPPALRPSSTPVECKRRSNHPRIHPGTWPGSMPPSLPGGSRRNCPRRTRPWRPDPASRHRRPPTRWLQSSRQQPLPAVSSFSLTPGSYANLQIQSNRPFATGSDNGAGPPISPYPTTQACSMFMKTLFSGLNDRSEAVLRRVQNPFDGAGPPDYSYRFNDTRIGCMYRSGL